MSTDLIFFLEKKKNNKNLFSICRQNNNFYLFFSFWLFIFFHDILSFVFVQFLIRLTEYSFCFQKNLQNMCNITKYHNLFFIICILGVHDFHDVFPYDLLRFVMSVQFLIGIHWKKSYHNMCNVTKHIYIFNFPAFKLLPTYISFKLSSIFFLKFFIIIFINFLLSIHHNVCLYN